MRINHAQAIAKAGPAQVSFLMGLAADDGIASAMLEGDDDLALTVRCSETWFESGVFGDELRGMYSFELVPAEY